MEAEVEEKLGWKVFKSVQSSSGCISKGYTYETDHGKIFVKFHKGSEADIMFRGEYESLKEIWESGILKVPRPFLVGKSYLVMEYLNFNSVRKFTSELGTRLAQLHLKNLNDLNAKKKLEGFIRNEKEKQPVGKFGFHVPTSCGYLSQNNEWCDDWVMFFAKQKLQYQVDMILKEKGNREINELWSGLQLKLPSFFKEITIQPSLLHGDLWFGNVGETQSEPIVFDPASFYGHHEYDLAIATMFGGFNAKFFDSYHNLIKKVNGFEKRQNLYLLFHHLNHWNHFGSHKNSSLEIMRNLLKT